ncbi:MAG: hypothetical protein P8L85_12795 [Rubripirellula sp.]|nr:hypothetical protein [Rubripirellula sp.]
MRISLYLSLLLTCLPTLSLAAQNPEISDPTVESPAIRTQLDAIRGVEEMGSLKKQLQELVRQNQMLTQRLLEATDKLDSIQREMGILRQGQEDAAKRRAALPPLRLIAQVRTDVVSRADITAGEQTYRIMDGKPFRLVLGNNEMVEADPKFMDDGTIEITIADLDSSYLLAFKPSPATVRRNAAAFRSDDD